MKTLFILLILILFSCEKQERCALCVTTYYVNESSYEDTLGILCNKDLKAMDGRVERVIEEDKAGYTMISITRCK